MVPVKKPLQRGRTVVIHPIQILTVPSPDSADVRFFSRCDRLVVNNS